MTIKDTHDLLLFELNKNEYGYISHSEIDDVLDRAQMEEFKFLLGDEREFSAGNAIGRTSFGISQSLNNALNPFITLTDYTNTEYNGANTGTALSSANQADPSFLILPSDWLYTLDIVTPTGARLDVVPQGKVSSRVRSRINSGEFLTYAGIGGDFNGSAFTTAAYRRYNRTSGQGGFTATLHYLKRPVKPNFAFTQSGRVVTHDAGSSTDLEWDDLHINKVIVRALILLGINVENQNVIGINNQKNKD
jgi:hypothetical protein